MSGIMKNGSPRESKNGSPAGSSASPDFWNEHDREAVSGLVAMVRRVEQHAFEIGDRGLIADAHSLLSGLVQLYDLLRDDRGGSHFWAWAPGRMAKLQCDFSAMISPQMFRQFMVATNKAVLL